MKDMDSAKSYLEITKKNPFNLLKIYEKKNASRIVFKKYFNYLLIVDVFRLFTNSTSKKFPYEVPQLGLSSSV